MIRILGSFPPVTAAALARAASDRNVFSDELIRKVIEEWLQNENYLTVPIPTLITPKGASYRNSQSKSVTSAERMGQQELTYEI